MKRTPKYIRSLQVFCPLLLLFARLAFAQSAPTWTGSISCQLDDEEQGVYQRQEIQTWTLTGAPRDPSQGMPVYPATWTAQAQGQQLRQQGTQATSIQWMANVPAQGTQPPVVGLAITVRASDGRLMIKQWTVLQNVPNAITGRRQAFVNGVPQGQPTTFNRALQQWQIPLIEASPTDNTVTGSAQIQADAGSAELVHRYGGGSPTATCRWNLTKGGNVAQNSGQGAIGNGFPNQNPQNGSGNPGSQTNGQNCQTPATVQQSFETMKADLQAQYDKLIQGTSDPNEIASLKNQEQRMIANLNNQQQRDMALASQGCLQATNTSAGGSSGGGAASGGAAGSAGGATGSAGGASSAGGGASAGGTNSGGAATGGAAGAAGSAGGASSAGGGANSGTNQNSGGSTNSGAGGAAGGSNAGNNSNAGAGPTVAPPTNVTATAGDSSAVVSWAASSSPIASYLVQTLPSGPTSTTSGNQLTIPGLLNGSTYTFQIIAVSSQGLTSRPVVSNPVTPVNSSAPTAGSAEKGSVVARQPSASLQTSASGAAQKLAANLPASLSSVRPGNSAPVASLAVTLTGTFTHFADGKTTATFVSAQAQPDANAACVNAALNKAADSYAQLLNSTNISALGSSPTRPNSNSPSNSNSGSNNSNSCPPPPVQVSVKVNSGTSATATLNIDPSAPPGAYNVTVTTPVASGQEVVSLSNAFYVVPGAGTGKSPAPASAKYRVVISGLMCIKAISSNDAVYAGAVVREYDRRNNQNTMFTNLNTWVYGDIDGLINQRKQAGTRGPLGGIGSGDFVPTGFMAGIRDTQPTPQVNNLLPLTLWEGPLTDGVDALVISPSLWINYGDNPLFTTWNQNEDSFNNNIFTDSRITNQISTQTLGTIVLGPSANAMDSATHAVASDAATAVIDTILVIPFVELQGPTHDRPIGLVDAAVDITAPTILPNTTLVLTREIIEKRLGTGSWALMQIDLNDTSHGFTGLIGSDRPGDYMMFIQIERQ